VDAENRDLQQLLWHRHRLVQMRTRIMNRILRVHYPDPGKATAVSRAALNGSVNSGSTQSRHKMTDCLWWRSMRACAGRMRYGGRRG